MLIKNILSMNIIWAIVGIVLLLILASIAFALRNKRPKNAKKITTRPVSDMLGNDSLQLDKLNKDLLPSGFSYDPYQDVFYSQMYGWQRNFGYCRIYDETSATLGMIIDCEPIRFEYNGVKWLIEFWKGQYGMTTGGEVGIYYTKGPELDIPGVFNGTFYFSVGDDDRINMAFAFKKNGKLMFTRSGFHWWLTGFKLGEFSKPSELTMDIILELYDIPMCLAFVAELEKIGYTTDEFSTNGRRINIHFDKPHIKQPFNRNSFTEYLMQKNNLNLCNAYHNLTKGYTDTLDKLQIIQIKSPSMYRQVINPGKSPLVFEAYDTIKGFLRENETNRED